MANTPPITPLVDGLRQLADRLADEGDKAMRRAQILAARGWPTSTNGSEGGRSSDPTSSVERAALNPGPFDNLDTRLTAQLNTLWVTCVFTHSLLDIAQAHVCTDVDCPICADQVPGGTGPCRVDGCDHVCNPRKNPDDRLRSLYCPKHYRRWLRMGRPDKGWFERYTETEDVA